MVALREHRAEWAEQYRREADRLLSAMAGRLDVLEHIGSTAVPDLVAKPILDLAARTAAEADPFALGEDLETLGYVQHTRGPKTHGVYVRSDGARRTHILHVFAPDLWGHCAQRLVRDHLLRDEEARRRYDAVKRSIAEGTDGRAYTAGKTDLIQELLTAERAARGLEPVVAWEK